MLDMLGIAASSGSACTSGSLDPSHVLMAIGLPHEIAHGSLRLSIGDFTTEEDIDYIIEKYMGMDKDILTEQQLIKEKTEVKPVTQQIEEKDLVWALEKTAHQAQRAGQIIHRIRSFVKRSEPNRADADVASMVNEAVELAEIELRRRNVRLSHYVATRLPKLHVDPILIEQVLVNLMKNAAESIDSAERPVGHRHVELRVVPKIIDQQNTLKV